VTLSNSRVTVRKCCRIPIVRRTPGGKIDADLANLKDLAFFVAMLPEFEEPTAAWCRRSRRRWSSGRVFGPSVRTGRRLPVERGRNSQDNRAGCRQVHPRAGRAEGVFVIDSGVMR